MTNPYNSVVPKYFPTNVEIVDSCDLILHDGSCQSLYNFFLPYANFQFRHNQRLLILDCDTDYYPDENCVGNNLFNLINLFSKLNISTDHVVIITGNYGLEKDVRILCDRYNLACPKVVEFSQWYVYPELPQQEINFSSHNKTHLYLSLNHISRSHRKILMAMLQEKKLLDHGIISWHAQETVNQENLSHTAHHETIDISKLCLRTTYPFTRINDDLNLCAQSIELMCKHHDTLDTVIQHPLITGKPNQDNTRWTADFFNHALLFLITETVGQYRHVYFSEKTWKAIFSKKPFLLLGAQHSLATLRKLGFITFNEIWDESYDSASSVFERADMITDVMIRLLDQDWKEIERCCQPIIQHNYDNLWRLQKKHIEQLQCL